MKKIITTLFACLTGMLLWSQSPTSVHVPIIDVSKPMKEVRFTLEDVANVKLLALEATDESLIKAYSSIAMSSDRIVVSDNAQGQVFIFDINGRFINKIAHRGQGPEDYQAISLSCVDFKNHLVYIWDYFMLGRIKIYDFSGRFVKQLNVAKSPWPDQMFVMDDENLIIWCNPDNLSSIPVGKHPYRLVNINSGKITPVNIDVNHSISNKYAVKDASGSVKSLSVLDIYPLIKAGGNVCISDFSNPLIYKVSGGKLYPQFKRTGIGNVSSGLERISALQNLTDKYAFLRVANKRIEKNTGKIEVSDEKILCYERTTKTIKDVDIYCRGLNSSVQLTQWQYELPSNTSVSVIPLFLLEKKYNDGKLSDEFHSFYESLDEEANQPLLITTFHQ